MDSLSTNLDLWVILNTHNPLCDYKALFDKVITYLHSELSEEDNDTLEEFCRRFTRAAMQRWKKSRRNSETFKKSYGDWLEANVDWPSCISRHRNWEVQEAENFSPSSRPSTSSASTMTRRKRKPFEDLGTKQKKNRTCDLMNENADELAYSAAQHLKVDGRGDIAAVIEYMLKHPEAATKLKEIIKKTDHATSFTAEKALSLLISLKLSKWQYITLRESATREGAKDLYPSYYKIQQAKLNCYPAPESVTVTDYSAEINLQALLDVTVKRLLDSLPERETEREELQLLCKWGFDGASSQSRYKQKIEGSEQDDASIFMTTLVPLKLTSGDKTIWTNPKPCSAAYCRPKQFTFIKESETVVLAQKAKMDQEIESLQPTEYKNFTVTYKLKMTMIDGKICTYLSKSRSNATCYVCLAKPTEMNRLVVSQPKTVSDTGLYEYGLSSLHARINTMECLLHISYRLDFKKWAARGKDLQEKMATRKKIVQDKFKEELNLLIDVVKQGSGTTNDGNTARKFFEDPDKTSSITGLDKDLIRSFAVILQAISSGEAIDVPKFKDYAQKTAEKYVQLYDWYHMSATVHKLLIHGADIIAKNAIVPIGHFSEEASEARNKDFRRYREHHSQKRTRKNCNQDVLNMLILSSDPLLTSMRPTYTNKKQRAFFPETLDLLLHPESQTEVSLGSIDESKIDSDSELDSDISDMED